MNELRSTAWGYTIIEVMIFLAVSGGLLLSAMTLIGGQQQRTEFVTAVRDFENKLQDILNDVETGYYPNSGNFQCTVPSMTIDATASPQIDPSASRQQGTNEDCIFIGRAIAFYRGADTSRPDSLRMYSIFGKRQTVSAGKVVDVNNIDDANTRSYAGDGATEDYVLRNGLELTRIIHPSFSDAQDSVAIVSSIGVKTEGTGSSTILSGSGAASSRLASLAISDFKGNQSNFIDYLENMKSQQITNAAGGAIFCLSDGVDGRPASVSVGVGPNTNRLSTDVAYDDEAQTLGCESAI